MPIYAMSVFIHVCVCVCEWVSVRNYSKKLHNFGNSIKRPNSVKDSSKVQAIKCVHILFGKMNPPI